MGRWLLAVLLLLPLPPLVAAPQRVVSLNVCSDQLLLLLADAQQIAGLSSLARDPELSYLADAAAGYPAVGLASEQLLTLQPDLVLVSSYTPRALVERLGERGVAVLTLPNVESSDGIRDNLRTLARHLQQVPRGEALIATLEQRLASSAPPPSSAPRALFLQPNGYTSGSGTLQDEALQRAGWHNAARDLGLEGYRPLTLEQLILLNPDQIITSTPLERRNALALRILHHPALQRIGQQRPLHTIDYRYWICAGPMLADAVEQLRQLRHAFDASARLP